MPVVAWARSSYRAHQGRRLWERGVDTSLFNPRRGSLAGRLPTGVSEAEPLLTLVGRAVWEKRLAAFAGVARALCSWQRHRFAMRPGPRDEVSEES